MSRNSYITRYTGNGGVRPLIISIPHRFTLESALVMLTSITSARAGWFPGAVRDYRIEVGRFILYTGHEDGNEIGEDYYLEIWEAGHATDNA